MKIQTYCPFVQYRVLIRIVPINLLKEYDV